MVFHRFVNACEDNGVDGLIIVDLQPEEDPQLLTMRFNFNEN